ncbi:MAG: bifunctional hydroxymethylpyrimidine kinase/phosphomethylpyrimidine kinase [Lentisphaerae bacterium]|nr:bifunctional hydroxymethylpyrimidine kinase/phosphomethylpyrimidine kinase [Lentisphaerota bacterium]
MPAVLTVAGSDSGGGAGIQADLKTFEAIGVFGTCAITCLTAQNPDGVQGVEAASPGIVAAQVKAVVEAFDVRAAKTGMLYSTELIDAAVEALAAARIPALVVDPVMVATSGARLLAEDAVEAMCRRLLPAATVVTPNLPEAEVLAGRRMDSLDSIRAAAMDLSGRYGAAFVVKGGHLEHGDDVVDVLADGGRIHEFRTPRIRTAQTHGTGCTFSAALAAYLALGRGLPAAVESAQKFVAGALRGSVPVGRHSPLRWRGAKMP